MTHPRTSEKIYSVIPKLSEIYSLDLFCIGQFSNNTKWYGDQDPRIKFHKQYDQYFEYTKNGPEFQNGDNYFEFSNNFNANDYDLVIYDDNRELIENQIPQIYNEFKKLDIPMIGNPHGNQNLHQNNIKALHHSFDYVFLFGEKELDFYSNFYDKKYLLTAGIPSNDIIKNYNRIQSYILLIINFLGNRSCPYDITFNKQLIYNIGLIEIAKESDVPIVIKQKSRHDDPNYQKNINYIDDWFNNVNIEYQIITDGDNDKIIENSAYVISSPSTFVFKSIQAGIPTILLEGTGENGILSDFNGLMNINKNEIKYSILDQIEKGKNVDFIKNTLEGGIDFTSTKKYIQKIKELC